MPGSRAQTVAERLLLPSPFLDGAAFREDSTAHILGRFQPSLPTPPRGGRKTPPPTPYPRGGEGALELRLDVSFIHAPSYSSILNFERRWAHIRTPKESRGTLTLPALGAPVHSPRPGGPGRRTGRMSASGNPAVPSRSLEVVL